MPFTGSHPAAVLPLVASPLPTSALVLGSIAPDLPYYVPDDPGWPTHTAVGIVTVDLLLGLAAWLLWHGLLAAPALEAAPSGVRARVHASPGLLPRLRQLPLVVIALGVGAATHVGWDEFTHPGRFGTQHVHWLATSHGGLEGYRWAQYASGIVGAAALLLALLLWWRRTAPRPAGRGLPWVWFALVSVATTVGVVSAASADSLRDAAFAGATRGGGAALLLALLLATIWWMRSFRS